MPETTKASDPFGTHAVPQDSLVLSIGEEEGDIYEAASELPPVGTYPAECIGVERKKSKNDNSYFLFTYRLLSPEAYAGTDVSDVVMLSGRMKFKLGQTCEAFEIVAEGKSKIDFGKCIGAKCNLVIKHRDREGQKQVDIQKVLPYEAPEGGSPFAAPAPPKADDIPF